jgi:hypothetical protein
MRKVFSLATTLLLLTAAAAVNSAYAISVGNSTHTATVTFDAALAAFDWSIAFKKVSDNTAATEITWDTSGVALGTTKWVDAGVYAVLTTTVTNSKARIQLYTRNTESTAYKYGGAGQSTSTSSGLILKSDSSSTVTLPFAFRMTDTLTPKKADNDNAATKVFPYSEDTTPKGFYDGGVYFTDNYADDFTTNSEKIIYRTLIDDKGFHWGGAATDAGGSTSGTFYIFFGANFGGATAPNTYGSDTITFRGFTE